MFISIFDRVRFAAVLAALLLPGISASQDAEKFQCSFGELQRRVEILHEPGVEVPCSVHYYKDTEAPGEQQELWSADRDPGYCTRKAEEFVAKLEGWGWDCGSPTDSANNDGDVAPIDDSDTDEELIDDPDVLAPEDQPT